MSIFIYLLHLLYRAKNLVYCRKDIGKLFVCLDIYFILQILMYTTYSKP